MNRQRTHFTIYAPTQLDDAGMRHVVEKRGGATLCGLGAAGEQDAPRDWKRTVLCPRCVQKYIRALFSYGKGQGWE